MTINTVFITIGILFLIEGIIIALFPKQIQKAGKSLLKNIHLLKKTGIVEIIIALALIIIGINL